MAIKMVGREGTNDSPQNGYSWPFKMSGKNAGAKVGGKGSWRRKVKKAPTGSQEADKVWLAAQRQGCRDIGEIDDATMILAQNDSLSFTKPELAIDMRANTYVLRGKPEKKPVSEILQDLLSGIDLSKFGGKAGEEKKEELGDVANVDFSKPEEAQPEEKKE